MNPMPASRFRKRGKLFTAIFVGEHSQDAGGPYRQTFSTMAQELETPSLPPLLPTPNGIGKIGRNRERWLLHPRAADATPHPQPVEPPADSAAPAPCKMPLFASSRFDSRAGHQGT